MSRLLQKKKKKKKENLYKNEMCKPNTIKNTFSSQKSNEKYLEKKTCVPHLSNVIIQFLILELSFGTIKQYLALLLLTDQPS